MLLRVFLGGNRAATLAFAGILSLTAVIPRLTATLALAGVLALAIMLGGFGGVSVDVGRGLELQAIAACVVGGVQLMGELVQGALPVPR